MDMSRKTTTQNGDVVPGGASTIGWFMTRSLRVYDGIAIRVNGFIKQLTPGRPLGDLGLSENIVPLNPLVNHHFPY